MTTIQLCRRPACNFEIISGAALGIDLDRLLPKLIAASKAGGDEITGSVPNGVMGVSDDERAIRDLVETWMDATRRGDIEIVLELMTDDVVFMTPGREPFGKQEFREQSAGMSGVQMDGRTEIREIRVLGDWAWIRNHIDLTATPTGGEPIRRSGYTLSILKKCDDGQWRLTRDANLVA